MEITHEIESGQVYEDSRTGDNIELIYVDRNVYVTQNEVSKTHRFGKRSEFERYVSSNRYKHKADADSFAETGDPSETDSIPFEELDSIGETAAENLRNAGYESCDDIERADESDLTDVSWVGEAGVESIKEYCNE